MAEWFGLPWTTLTALALLPVAAASGWWWSRRGMRRSTDLRCSTFSTDYFRGLNYLINEQTDKAIEVFIRMLEDDPETVETHLALGSLFRRRGETSKAIQIHQNLIARTGLESRQRVEALYELGRDYLQAGLLDRAERPFRELVDLQPQHAPSRSSLAEIYEQEKDWDKAIEAVRGLGDDQLLPRGKVIAQYFCEKAQGAHQQGDRASAREFLRNALDEDDRCVRASQMYGDLEREAGNCAEAVSWYRHVEEQDKDFLPEVVEPMLDCLRRIASTTEVQEQLRRLLRQHPRNSILLALVEEVRRDVGEQAAEELLMEELQRKPSVLGLERLIDLKLSHIDDPQTRGWMLGLKTLSRQLLEDRPRYQCGNCGFQARHVHWQCPGCKEWNTVRPLIGVAGE
jgi:lipopolysaccharide biosynthesis regulator YciM